MFHSRSEKRTHNFWSYVLRLHCTLGGYEHERLQLGFPFKGFGLNWSMAGSWAETYSSVWGRVIQKSSSIVLAKCTGSWKEFPIYLIFSQATAPTPDSKMQFWEDWEPKGHYLTVYHMLNYEALILFCNQGKQNIIYKRNHQKRSVLRSDWCIPTRKRLSFEGWWLINTLISLPMVETYSFLESVKWHKRGAGFPGAVGKANSALSRSPASRHGCSHHITGPLGNSSLLSEGAFPQRRWHTQPQPHTHTVTVLPAPGDPRPEMAEQWNRRETSGHLPDSRCYLCTQGLVIGKTGLLCPCSSIFRIWKALITTKFLGKIRTQQNYNKDNPPSVALPPLCLGPWYLQYQMAGCTAGGLSSPLRPLLCLNPLMTPNVRKVSQAWDF